MTRDSQQLPEMNALAAAEKGAIGLASNFYQGEPGEHYFRRQSKGGIERGRLNARTKFARYVDVNDTVLDFGCGDGALLTSLRCSRRIGVEINPVARQHAESYGIEVYDSLSKVVDGIVDIAVSNHALEHVICPAATLAEIRSKLRPMGRLVVCVPLSDWRVEKRTNPDDPNHHLYTWTPLILGNLLRETGFNVESVQIFTYAWIPYWHVLHERIPTFLFDGLCHLRAQLQRRRQLVAFATRNP